MSLNEELLSKSKKSSDTTHTDKGMESTIGSGAAPKPHKKQALLVALTKNASIFPEKVSDFSDNFSLRSVLTSSSS